MPSSLGPSISAVVAAYPAEQWIEETLDSILGQSRPPDEVVVVDDASTDGTPRILDGYADRIRVLRQENAGYPAAMNRAIQDSSSEFVAPRGADDLRAGAVFYYDPWMLVRYRRHDVNVSSNHRAMAEADVAVHRWNADLVDSPSLVREVLARDHLVLGRLLRDEDRPSDARAAFVTSLRQRLTLRGLSWALLLSAPERHRRTLSDRVIGIARAVSQGLAIDLHRRLSSRARPQSCLGCRLASCLGCRLGG